MASLKKYNLLGEELGSVEVSDEFAKAEPNAQQVYEYIKALRENARQWSASTKTRKEVKHTTRKPRPQKGSGRARQGMLCTPQFRGGGVVFGPKPKFNQHVRLNRKERKQVLRALIGEVIREERLIILEEMTMAAPKTKTIGDLLQKVGENRGASLFLAAGNYQELEQDGKKVRLNIRSVDHRSFEKSTRNIPRVGFSIVKSLNGDLLLRHKRVFITEEGLSELQDWLT